MTGPGSSPVGGITIERTGAGWVAHLTGEVDAAVVQEFAASADAPWGPSGGAHDAPAERSEPVEVVLVTAVDTSGVTFIDSSGLALMLKWAAQAREQGLVAELLRPSHAVVTMLQLSGTQSLFANPGAPAATAGARDA